jgi:undecaprenyl-diphosphatase
MTILQTIILGIVEGVTEFLPISSTGHLLLTSKLLGISDTNFTKSFEIVIQFGAILAVVVLYGKRIWSHKDIWKKVLVAFLPTAVIGFLLYKILKNYLLSSPLLVIWTLLLGGVLLIVFELWHKKRSISQVDAISYQQSLWVGLAQSLAIIPGVSRSGATIVAGLIMGISRQAIVEFSFLLAIPTMAAATGYDLLKSAGGFSGSDFWILALGFVVSFVAALASIRWFINYVKNHSFIWFGVYRIFIALLFYLLIFQFKL